MHRLVAEITDEAAAEPRQPWIFSDPETQEILFDERERIFVRLALDDAIVFDLATIEAAHFDAAAGGKSDERVAAEALTADDGFQKVGIRLVREFQVNGQR